MGFVSPGPRFLPTAKRNRIRNTHKLLISVAKDGFNVASRQYMKQSCRLNCWIWWGWDLETVILSRFPTSTDILNHYVYGLERKKHCTFVDMLRGLIGQPARLPSEDQPKTGHTSRHGALGRGFFSF